MRHVGVPSTYRPPLAGTSSAGTTLRVVLPKKGSWVAGISPDTRQSRAEYTIRCIGESSGFG